MPIVCKRISIMELTETTCRYPLGDPMNPGFVYCGNECDVAAPYCGDHMRFAYQPGTASRPRIPARATSPIAKPAPNAMPDLMEMFA